MHIENGKSATEGSRFLEGAYRKRKICERRALRKKGVSMISNAPLCDDTSYITASKQKIYKDNYQYVEDQFGYLIGGTVKFVSPVQANEDGTYSAHLIADIYGINMKTILYSQSESELKKANDRILELSASIKFFKAFPTANIAFVIMNLVGTILVGLGAPSNLWLIILGAILVIAGNALPYCFIKKGDNL